MTGAKIVASTPWSKGGNGEYPARYVVRYWKDRVQPYSRHLQVNDGIHTDNFVDGRYFGTFSEAMEEVSRSVWKNNRGQAPGGCSYIVPHIKTTKSNWKKMNLGKHGEVQKKEKLVKMVVKKERPSGRFDTLWD